jgi:hypothetical protein
LSRNDLHIPEVDGGSEFSSLMELVVGSGGVFVCLDGVVGDGVGVVEGPPAGDSVCLISISLIAVIRSAVDLWGVVGFMLVVVDGSLYLSESQSRELWLSIITTGIFSDLSNGLDFLVSRRSFRRKPIILPLPVAHFPASKKCDFFSYNPGSHDRFFPVVDGHYYKNELWRKDLFATFFGGQRLAKSEETHRT